MAGKSPSELMRELQLEVTKLFTQMDVLREEVRKANLVDIRERLAVLDEVWAEARKKLEEFDHRGERLAVLEAQHAELKKQFDEKDRRWWQFWAGVGLVGVTFVANLVIQLVLLFSRKTV